jgi:hypothetical protein
MESATGLATLLLQGNVIVGTALPSDTNSMANLRRLDQDTV